MQILSHVGRNFCTFPPSPVDLATTLSDNLDVGLSLASVRCHRHSEDAHTISRRGYWMPISQRDSFLFASLPPDKRNPGGGGRDKEERAKEEAA